jgi:iron(III) transport system substrate-binding protein
MSQGAELALHLLGAYAERTVAADSSLHLASSAVQPISVGRVAFIPRRAANPGVASAFLSYMVSPAGQAAIGACGLFPIAAPSSSATAPIPINDGFSRFLDSASRASLLARWQAALGRSKEQSRRKQA